LVVRREPGVVVLWDARAHRIISEQDSSRWPKALAASPTNHLFAWGTRESNGAPSVVLWDTAEGREVARLSHASDVVSSQFFTNAPRVASLATNDVVSLAFSRDAQWLATLTRHSELSVWNVNSRTLAQRFQIRTNFHLDDGSHHGSVVFSPRGRLLAVGIGEAQVQLMDWVNRASTNITLSKPANSPLKKSCKKLEQYLRLNV
jgi:WD40 repeat protein